MLCDELDGWDGGWGGREAQEKRDIYIYVYIAESLHCTAETNPTL